MQAKKAIITDAKLIEKAKQFSERLHCEDFRHQAAGWAASSPGTAFHHKNVHREAALVDLHTVTNCSNEPQANAQPIQSSWHLQHWRERTFYRMLPSKPLCQGPQHGTNQFKDRVIVALCVNTDGSDYTKPLVIGKSVNPRCFRISARTLTSSVPITARHGWRATYSLSSCIILIRTSRTRKLPVLLLMDNVPSHFPEVQLSVPGWTICLQTPLALQTLDTGTIYAFKAH